MKKIMVAVQILVVLLVLVKVASVFGLLDQGDAAAGSSFWSTEALAQPQLPEGRPVGESPVQEMLPEEFLTVAPRMRDAMEDTLAKKRDLSAALIQRQEELEKKDNAMRAEEQRLLALRKDIMEKIALLAAQEARIALVVEQNREEEIQRFRGLARVYEATPPRKAGPMLEKLDTKTAAGITMQMKKENAGALWAFISPEKAAEITREVTRANGQ